MVALLYRQYVYSQLFLLVSANHPTQVTTTATANQKVRKYFEVYDMIERHSNPPLLVPQLKLFKHKN